ncbi:MAG: hypothetical protein LBH66_06595 [Oscillospiraceae bacterium]|jgi:hypothetical protein|nr:hypothetical protein [Oscillospiraceae bacterium]
MLEPNEPRPCPDFDREFERFTRAWLRKYAPKYGGDLSRMESRIPDLYVRWLNKPVSWLDGRKPGMYFASYGDPTELIGWAADYARADVSLPAPLMDRISILPGAEEALLKALADASTPYALRLTIVPMLSEMKSVKPMPLYIKWIANRLSAERGGRVHRDDDLAELCAEALARMGPSVVEPILEAAPGANPAGQETFLDILCNFPGDKRIVELGVELFERGRGSTALIAAYLGKLGDPKALPPLERALHGGRLAYLDYIEVRNAVEELGGGIPDEQPDFAGDPGYESLKALNAGW